MADWVINRRVLDLPITDGEWDKDATEEPFRRWVSDKDPSEWGREEWQKYSLRYLVYRENPSKFEDFKFPVVEIVGGEPHVNRRAVIAVQQNLAGARTPAALPSDVKADVAQVAAKLREKADKALGVEKKEMLKKAIVARLINALLEALED